MNNINSYRQYLAEVGDPGAAATLVLADAINTPDLLDVRQAAAMLSVGRSTICRMLQRGEIQPVKIGRTTRIRRADLLAIVDRGAA